MFYIKLPRRKLIAVVVSDSTILKNKRVFLCRSILFIFNLCENIKKIGLAYKYIILQPCDYPSAFALLNVDMLELLVCWLCWCKLVHLVSMFPVDWLYRSLLWMRLYIEAFTFFHDHCLAWLSQIWVLGLEFPIPHTLLQVIITYRME